MIFAQKILIREFSSKHQHRRFQAGVTLTVTMTVTVTVKYESDTARA